MAMIDRVRKRLVNRLVVAGVPSDVAHAMAYANFPVADEEVMRIVGAMYGGEESRRLTDTFLADPSPTSLYLLMGFLFGVADMDQYRSGRRWWDVARETREGRLSIPDSELVARGEFQVGGADLYGDVEIFNEEACGPDYVWCLITTGLMTSGVASATAAARDLVTEEMLTALRDAETGLPLMNAAASRTLSRLPSQEVVISVEDDGEGRLMLAVSDYGLADIFTPLLHRAATALAMDAIGTQFSRRLLIASGAMVVAHYRRDPQGFAAYRADMPEVLVQAALEHVKTH